MFQEFIQSLSTFFVSIAHSMPLEAYVFFGSFLEEIIAPIPQSLIVVVAGTMAKAQSYSLFAVLVLALLSAVGKTLASWILYVLGDKAEHIVVGKFGRMLGVSNTDISKWSTYINKGKRDVIALFLARMLPVIPTAPVSIVCGVLKIDLKNFLLISIVGLTIRDAMFLYVGYIGVSTYNSLSNDFGNAESIIKIIVFILFLGFFCWVGFKMTRRRLKEMDDSKNQR